MPFDWNAAAEGNGESVKLTPGSHTVTCTKVMTEDRDGNPRVTKNGDPGILIVVENERGEEGTVFFTLSAKGAWSLARWLSAIGVDLKAMQTRGVEPRHFARKDIAEKALLGKSCAVEVSAKAGSDYVDIVPVRGNAPPAAAPIGDADLDLDSIPF